MTRLLDVASFETVGQEDKEVAGIRVRVATAAAPVAVPPGEGFERFARQCARYWTIAPRVYPTGVFRFRALAEEQAARQRVTDDNVARLRAATSKEGR